MDLADFYFFAAASYGVCALWAIYRAGLFQWFWGSVLLWLGICIVGAELLPGMWGMMHAGPLFIPHFYLTAASILFFAGHWQKMSNGLWQADGRHPFLSLFAVTNLLMTLVFVMLVGMVGYNYPGRTAVSAAAAMLDFYALRPVFWFILQGVVAAVFYLHRTVIMKQASNFFSIVQLQGGFLLALILQTLTIAGLLIGGRA